MPMLAGDLPFLRMARAWLYSAERYAKLCKQSMVKGALHRPNMQCQQKLHAWNHCAQSDTPVFYVCLVQSSDAG